MNVKFEDLQCLLEIEEIRVQNSRSRIELTALLTGNELRAKEEERIRIAGELAAEIELQDELRTELKRAETDLGMVEARIARDSKALSSTTSSKDAAGLQHELETLAKRKSDLEDSQLEAIERLESQTGEVARLTALRETLASEVGLLQTELKDRAEALRVDIQRREAESKALEAKVAVDLLELYREKVERGIPIGRLKGLTCSACNMGITSSSHRELSATPIDQLVTCPECSAILVRDA